MATIYNSVLDYINQQPAEYQTLLLDIRNTILSIVPENTIEKIAYNMPTYSYKKNLIHFALFKNFIAVYPGAEALHFLEQKIKNYKTTGNGGIHFPLNDEIPHNLIKEMIIFNVQWFKQNLNVKIPNT